MSPSRSERRARDTKPKFTAGHLIIGVTIALLLAGVGGYSYWAYYTSTTQYRIEQAFDLIDSAQKKLDVINVVIDSDITDETAGQIDDVRETIEPTRELLREAADYIKRAQENATDEEMERLVSIQESIALRGQLLGLIPDLLDVTEQSATALRGVNVGWEKLVEATGAATAAKEAFDKQDKAGMLESVKQNNEALSALARARVEFNDAERALEGLSFEVYITYIDIREQMAQSAIKAANDWTGEDQTALKIDLDKYAELLMQATIMEETDLVAPADLVAQRYHELVGAKNAEYFEIREQVLTLDNKVR
ncbi:MAG: hypothetical protein FWD41_00570 [Actinomycetia bacterium]|nr:hypothetical protein [Actinomycetes bacterium]